MNRPAPEISTTNACPHPTVLSDYLQGYVDDSTAARVDAHLEACETCNGALARLETDLLPTIDRIQDETQNDGLQPAANCGDEEDIIRQVIACSHLPAGSENAAWRYAMFHQAPDQVGPYRLIRAIGRGGMGCVYHAEHRKLQKRVALKLMPLGLANPQMTERFEREIRAAGKLNHPAIVTSTDAGTDAGYLYLAMEFIEGFDLGKIVRSSERLRIEDVCEIGRQVALGLAHAHQMGMVHRDIKPSNIMLDCTGKVKLLDFGLVMLNQWDSPLGELTTVGQFLGTLDYMAPEQAERSASVDHRSDLYSLGATLFRLLTGHLPVAILPNHSPLEKLRVLSNHSPLQVTTLRDDVPEPCAKLIDLLLKTDPNLRPASAAHVAELLGPHSLGADLSGLATSMAQLVSELGDEPHDGVGSQLHRNFARASGASSGRRRGRWLLAIATAFVPFLVYYGWTVIVENAKGNLVIQSDVEDLHVHISKVDGSKSDSLTIQQGNSLTRLQAGEYEIKLDSPSDEIVLEPELVALKRGETVIARIRRENPAAPQAYALASDGAPSGSRDWFPQGILSEELLQATYKDKSILDHLKQIHLEREFSTWQASLTVLGKAIPDLDKPKLSSFIHDSAERKGFLNGLDCLTLRDWIPYDQLDAKIAQWIGSDDERVLAFLEHCCNIAWMLNFEVVTNKLKQGDPALESMRLPMSWQQVENWLASDEKIQRRLKIEHSLRSVGKMGEVPVGHPLNKLLYANYPITALTIAAYYKYPTGMGGITSGTTLLPTDPEQKQNRLNARITLTKDAIANENLQDFFWQLKKKDDRAEVEEAEWWTLVAGFVAKRLERWAASNDSLLNDLVVSQLGIYASDSWTVLPIATRQQKFSGMSGGMGGLGGGGTFPSMIGGLTTLPSVRVSESIELLCAYEMLPKSRRPRIALEKVRAMLETKDRELSEHLKEVFDGEWTGRSWSDDMKLQRFTPDGSTEVIAEEDQAVAAAFVLHRWVDGLLESDFLDPIYVAQSFFQMLKKDLIGDPSPWANGRDVRDWLHTSIRAEWSNEEVSSKLSLPHGSHFDVDDVDYVQMNANTASVIVKLANATNTSSVYRVKLGLEREGWRIQSIEAFTDGKSKYLLNKATP